MTQAVLREVTDDATLNAGTSLISVEKARALVELFAKVTTSRDPSAVANGFTEDCVGRFNCTELHGREQIRAFFAERFPRFSDSYKCVKTLRSINGNVLGVTWHSTWEDPVTGKSMQGRGTEFWVMRGDLVAGGTQPLGNRRLSSGSSATSNHCVQRTRRTAASSFANCVPARL